MENTHEITCIYCDGPMDQDEELWASCVDCRTDALNSIQLRHAIRLLTSDLEFEEFRQKLLKDMQND